MKFLADENFNGHLYRALHDRFPAGALTRVQDVGMMGADDPKILEWAAENGCIVLTHDISTFTDFAYSRVSKGLPMPGVLQVRKGFAIQTVVYDIKLLFHCNLEDDLKDLVSYVPF